jgi:UDP-N-acetylmuramate--alanine ligase
MTRIHLIGIGGTGLSAIARVLLEMGHTVSGSDRAESPFTQELEKAGVTIKIGHSSENIHGIDLVVRSSAISDDNPEVVTARAFRIPVLKRADFLGSLMEGKISIAVAGTHGKTTTTSMIAWMLTALDQDPTFIVGGIISNLGVNARAGKGKTFVIEADEYDRMFLGLKPSIAVVTNVEHDHPDCYPTPEDFFAAFREFVIHLPANGMLVACAEDLGARQLITEAEQMGKNVLPYSIRPTTDGGSSQLSVYTTVLSPNQKGGYTFTAMVMGNTATVELQVPGKHNVRNALAALTVAQILGLPLDAAARALGEFQGTGRRFEVRGVANGVTVIDDYAHHPTEIRATLAAARTRYLSHRIWAVWQPHTYSRTQTLFKDFTTAFKDADEVIVTEVYAAREAKQDYSSQQVVDAMKHSSAHFIAGLKDVSNYLISNLRPGDVLLVLSAGDADSVSTKVLTHLKEAENG